MDIATYAAEAAVESDHWWFVGRRGLLSDIIAKLGLSPGAEILDVGTSTGTNLRMLRDLGFHHVQGIDQSPEAVRYCSEKGLGEVHLGDVCALPFSDCRFDLILATDIIEHVDDDLSALRELHRVLKPGSHLLLTVPTFHLLWGLQDDVSHHKRRYRLHELLPKLLDTEFALKQNYYFNYFLFLPILMGRCLVRMLRITVASEAEINTWWLNRILTLIFRLDVKTAPWLRPPFGVSALVVAVRK
jgi:SAM-dependent methyltransferase